VFVAAVAARSAEPAPATTFGESGSATPVAEFPRAVVCGECGGDFNLSARNIRAARARGEEPRCRRCRFGEPKPASPAEQSRLRHWWLERYSVAEIREMAAAIWGESAISPQTSREHVAERSGLAATNSTKALHLSHFAPLAATSRQSRNGTRGPEFESRRPDWFKSPEIGVSV
jgi:hypothetical protein